MTDKLLPVEQCGHRKIIVDFQFTFRLSDEARRKIEALDRRRWRCENDNKTRFA